MQTKRVYLQLSKFALDYFFVALQ